MDSNQNENGNGSGNPVNENAGKGKEKVESYSLNEEIREKKSKDRDESESLKKEREDLDLNDHRLAVADRKNGNRGFSNLREIEHLFDWKYRVQGLELYLQNQYCIDWTIKKYHEICRVWTGKSSLQDYNDLQSRHRRSHRCHRRLVGFPSFGTNEIQEKEAETLILILELFVFCQGYWDDFRKEFQEQNPDVKSIRDVGTGLAGHVERSGKQ